MQRRAVSAAVIGLAIAAFATDALADDQPIVTKAPPPVAVAPATPSSCTGVWDFFATTCQLAYYGLRFYGTVDICGGWESHGAPYNPAFLAGDNYYLLKANRAPMWLPSPNALSQSAVGVAIKEQFAPGWSVVGDLEAGFQPYSFELANGPSSVYGQRGIALDNQLSSGDSSRAGQFYNALGFVGVSSDTLGTLTFFRQNSLTLDGVLAYDPMGGSYAFSPIGFSGMTAGVGDTEDARFTTSVKYRVNVGWFRFGALGQFGGYQQDNASQGAVQGQFGGDIPHVGPGTFSFDFVGSFVKDAVFVTLAGFPLNGLGQPVAPFLPTTYTAIVSNDTSFMALAKYTMGPLRLFGGYEYINYAAPSDPQSSFTDIAGNFVCAGCAALNGTNISNAAFTGRVMQIMWMGAKYTVIKDVDIAVGYYHYIQNAFAPAASALKGCTSSVSGMCAGTEDFASFLLDWQFSAKADAYFGFMYTQVNGGLSNGYLARNNIDPTVGLRFRF